MNKELVKMSDQTIFKLKSHVTKDDLAGAGYEENRTGVLKKLRNGCEIYIPFIKSSRFGERVIQYNEACTSPEELNPEDIEDLIAQGWVEEIEYE